MAANGNKHEKDVRYLWEEWLEEQAVMASLGDKLKSGSLVSGKIPDNVFELMRLVDDQSEDGKKFQAYMEGLTLKLLPNWDFKEQPIRFFIVDDDSVNASVIAGHKPAMVFFNKGMLKLVGDNENMLLHTLGHELGHELFRETVGNIRVTKPEEILVNMPAIQWMYENGINPEPAVTLARKIAKISKDDPTAFPTDISHDNNISIGGLLDMAVAITDEHPTPAFDVDLLNSAVVAYRNQVAGNFKDRKLLKIPGEMRELFKRVRHVSHITQTRDGVKFADMEWKEQLEFIRDQLKDAEKGYVNARTDDLKTILESVDNPVNDESRAIGREMIVALAGKPRAFGKLYPIIAANLFNTSKTTPLPPLDELMPAMQAVTSAKDYESFCATSTALVETTERYKSYPLQQLNWPTSFTVPNSETVLSAGSKGVKPSWSQQVKWATDALKQGNEAPAIALMLLGVEDPTLYDAMPDTLLKRLWNGLSISIVSEDGNIHISRPELDMAGEPIKAISALSRPLSGYSLETKDGETIIRSLHTETEERRSWHMLDGIRAVLSKREASSLHSELQKPAAQQFKHTDTLPFHDEAGFTQWFTEHRQALTPPAIFTSSGRAIHEFHSQLAFWLGQDKKEQNQSIADYRNAIAKGKSGDSARYSRHFFRTMVTQVLPFEEQSAQVTKMLDAQLQQNGETGRELVRAFFLNPAQKPGLRQLLESGERGASLTAQNPYINFLVEHKGLFSVEEKASIISQHVALPENPLWWQRMLETPEVTDINSLLTFITTAERFSNAIRPLDEIKTPLFSNAKKDAEERLAFFSGVAQTYCTAIFGYNYTGQYDLSNLLENPPKILGKICAAERDVLEERNDLEFSFFINSILTDHTINTFKEWCAENTIITDADPITNRVERGRKLTREERYAANLHHLDEHGGQNIEFAFTDIYSANSEERIKIRKRAVIPPIPIKDTDTIRDILRKHVSAQQHWPDEHLRRAKIYKTIDNLDLFANAKHEEKFRNRLLADLRAESNLDSRMATLQVLLAGEPVKDPTMRKDSAKLWAETLHQKLQEGNLGKQGLDDGSEAYKKTLMPYIEWAEKDVSISERYQLFVYLADKLESQRDISYRLRDSFMITGQDALNADSSFKVGEAVLVFAIRDDKNRQRLLDYFMQENTDASRRTFANWLQKTAKEVQATEAIGIVEEKFEKAIPYVKDIEYYILQAQNIYNNFWQAPLPARIVIMDQLLMTPEEKNYDRDGEEQNRTSHAGKASALAYTRAFNYVTDQLLPKDIQYSKESRIALETYKNVLPVNERALFLSAILAANDASRQSGHSMSAGERLAVVLEMMGPATVKFGQALSNYPDAPMDLRKPMVRLTKHAAPSTRWDLWARHDEVVPAAYQQNTQRMGKVMGTGSYQESVRLEKKDGTRSVLKLQRPHVERRAEAGFAQLRDFVQELQQKETGLHKDVAEATDAVVHQAQKMAQKETDAVYRQRQVKQAESYYNPMEIGVNGHTFHFRTAGWIAYGVDRKEVANRSDRKEWCDEEEMPGVHFDELPEHTDKEKKYKKDVAKAIITAELAVLLSGRPIDHDRHTAQMRVDSATNRIGLFDHGALDLEPPTKQEKQLLAKILVSATQAYETGTSLPDLFYKQLQAIKAELGSVPNYLVKVERGVLAMTPFFEQMSGNDLKEALAAVHTAGVVDKDILDTKIKVKIPIVGEQNVKLSTILGRALPKDGNISLTLRKTTISREPQRFEYEQAAAAAHPQFPGVKPDAPPANGAGKPTGDDGDREGPHSAKIPKPKSQWKMGMERRSQSTEHLR